MSFLRSCNSFTGHHALRKQGYRQTRALQECLEDSEWGREQSTPLSNKFTSELPYIAHSRGLSALLLGSSAAQRSGGGTK